MRVTLTDRGRAIRGQTGCLGDALMARSGLTPSRLADLNAQIQALREALIDGGGDAAPGG